MEKRKAEIGLMLLLFALLLWARPVKAATMAAGKTYSGYLGAGYGNTRTYYYTTPKKGYIYFSGNTLPGMDPWGHVYTDGSFWVKILRASDGKEFDELRIESGEGTCYSKKYTFPPKTRLKLVVEEHLYNDYHWAGYNFRVKVVKPKNFETNGNNIKRRATKLKAGRVCKGISMEDFDDWFYFKAPKAGTYRVYGAITEGSNEVFKVTKGLKEIGNHCCSIGDGYERITTVKLKKGAKIYIHAYNLWNSYGRFQVKVKRAK